MTVFKPFLRPVDGEEKGWGNTVWLTQLFDEEQAKAGEPPARHMSKVGSAADAAARDCAIAASLALQWGADSEVFRKAMCRDARGKAVGPVGILLDLVTANGDVT